MANELYTNDPGSILASGITNSNTNLTVADSTGYPTSGNFRVRLDNELMLVTAVSGNVFTISRALEGTIAASHDFGVPVNHVITAGSMNEILSELNQFGTWASRPISTVGVREGTWYNCNDSIWNLYFDGSSWNYYMFGKWLGTPVTALNQTTLLNATINNSVTSLVVTGNFGSMPSTPFRIFINNEQIKVTSVSGTTWTIVRGDAGTTAASHTGGATITQMSYWWHNWIDTTNQILQYNGYFFINQNGTGYGDGADFPISVITPLTHSAPWTIIAIIAPYIPSAAANQREGLALAAQATATNELHCYTGNRNGSGQYEMSGAYLWGAYTGGYDGASAGITSDISYINVPTSQIPNITSPMWIKIQDDGSSFWTGFFSFDGINYIQASHCTRNATVTADSIGPFVNCRNSRNGLWMLSLTQYSGLI